MAKDMINIVTWNINSLRKRLDLVERVIQRLNPDILCLQETKVPDGLFPTLACRALGFSHQAIYGQKGYNGVAILSKFPIMEETRHTWGGLSDQARHLSCVIEPPDTAPLIVDSLYIPAGGEKPNPKTNEKFRQKLSFFETLSAFWQTTAKARRRHIVVGDFNVAPLIEDVWSHERLKNVVTHSAIEREILIALEEDGGWVDAVRAYSPPPEKLFTWWSYRTKDWVEANKGRRLDHIWVSPDLEDQIAAVTILSEARGWPQPSDHVPVKLSLGSE